MFVPCKEKVLHSHRTQVLSDPFHFIDIPQTKKAMNVILSDLQANDYFNIISFSDTVNVWKAGGSIQATAQNVHSAKNYLDRMEAEGCKCSTDPLPPPPNAQAWLTREISEALSLFSHPPHFPSVSNITIVSYRNKRECQSAHGNESYELSSTQVLFSFQCPQSF